MPTFEELSRLPKEFALLKKSYIDLAGAFNPKKGLLRAITDHDSDSLLELTKYDKQTWIRMFYYVYQRKDKEIREHVVDNTHRFVFEVARVAFQEMTHTNVNPDRFLREIEDFEDAELEFLTGLTKDTWFGIYDYVMECIIQAITCKAY